MARQVRPSCGKWLNVLKEHASCTSSRLDIPSRDWSIAWRERVFNSKQCDQQAGMPSFAVGPH